MIPIKRKNALKYFDNAATGFPKSKSVINEITKALSRCGNPGRSEHEYSVYASEVLYSVRETLAKFFSTDPENVILCPSSTYALNMAIKGLYKDNSKIIISDLEHNSVYRPAIATGKTCVFCTDIENDENTLYEFKKTITTDTSIAVVTHASNVCGRILPVEEMANSSHKNGTLFILDASQTAGYIPIDLSNSNIDVVCIPGHKGFYGPMGTGALIVNPKSRLEFKTIIEGGAGSMSLEKTMPLNLPERLEAGTCNVHDFAGLNIALKECVFDKGYDFQKYIFTINNLKKINNLTIYGYSEKNSNKYVPVILFNAKGIPSDKFSERLKDKGFCVRSGFHCSPLAHEKLQTGEFGAVRISIGKKNTFKECEELVYAINDIVK